MKYSDRLKDYKWQKKVTEVKIYYDNQCQMCFDKDAYMHVHHQFYTSFKKAWEYDVKDLILLCPVCHTYIHEEENKEYVLMLCNELKCNPTQLLILLHRLRYINTTQATQLITSQIITKENM